MIIYFNDKLLGLSSNNVGNIYGFLYSREREKVFASLRVEHKEVSSPLQENRIKFLTYIIVQ